MALPTRQKFEQTQEAYRIASRAVDKAEIALSVRYGRGNEHFASRTELKRLDQLRKRRSRECDRVLRLLEKAPRDWTTGVPVWWVCGELSYEDAFRPFNEPLSIKPPLAFGATEPKRLLNNFPNPFRKI